MKSDDCPTARLYVTLAAIAVMLWAYWSTLLEVAERWATDPQYSHGFLVPLFSAYLLWTRRSHLKAVDLLPRGWGLGIVALAIVMRMAGFLFYQSWLDTGSLLVCLIGIAAAAGGRRAVIWAGPAILFLVFMLPLPFRVQHALGDTLQTVATIASTYALQTLGVPAVAEGHVILLTDTRLGVVDACSGLSMLITFFALATAVAILAPRSLVEKVIIFLSAMPIAVLSNVVRITVTGLLYEASQDHLARVVFHDLAGWLMMPLALGMLLVELFVLGRSVVHVRGPAPKYSGAVVPVVG